MTKQIDIQKLLNEASFLEERLRFKESEQKYAEVLKYKPKHVLATYGVAYALFRQNKISEAEELLEKGCAQHPKYTYFYDLATTIKMSQGKHDEAQDIINSWLQNCPLEGAPYTEKARLLMAANSKDKKEILDAATTGIKNSIHNAEAYGIMGEAEWYCNRDIKKASASYDQALRLNPGNAALHNNYGTVLLLAGKKKKALEEFQTAVRLDPTLEVSVANMGVTSAYTNPLFSWSHKLGALSLRERLIIFGSIFVIQNICIELVKIGFMSRTLYNWIFYPYLILVLYVFFGVHIYSYAYKKGWIK